MAFVYDTKAQATLSNDTTMVLSYTCGVGTKLLVLCIAAAETDLRTGGSPTYNDVPMVQADSERVGSYECTSELWYMLQPPTGAAYNISVPNSARKLLRLQAISFTNTVNALFDQAVGTNTSSATPSLTINNVPDGAVVVDSLGHGRVSVQESQSHTPVYSNDEGAWVSNAQYTIKSETGNLTFSYTYSLSDDVAYVMASFKEEAAGISIPVAMHHYKMAGGL